jgi:hypothetical protein
MVSGKQASRCVSQDVNEKWGFVFEQALIYKSWQMADTKWGSWATEGNCAYKIVSGGRGA